MTRAPIAAPSSVALSPTGPWPKTASVVAAGDAHALQRAVGGAGAAGDRGAFGEGQLVGQRHQRGAGTFMYRRGRRAR